VVAKKIAASQASFIGQPFLVLLAMFSTSTSTRRGQYLGWSFGEIHILSHG